MFSNFTNFKTSIQQSVGKAEKTQEDADFQEMIKVMKETKIELTNIYDLSKKFHKLQQEAAETQEKLSGAFSKLTSTESSARANMLELTPMVSKASAAQIEFLNNFKVNVVDVINSILEIQQRQAEKAYKSVEETRLSYDGASHKFKSVLENTKKSTQEDIDRAKQVADTAETAYQKAKETCTEACAELAKHKDQFAIEKVATVAQSLGEQGANFCQAAQTCLESATK